MAAPPSLGRLASLWHEGAKRRQRAPLDADLSVDVAVLGAGITGLATAQLLRERGARVAVLEARHVGAGTSGYTTAKLSSLHGLTYTKLMRSVGEERTRIYGQANEAGIARIFRLSRNLAIDCDLRRKPNLTYTPSADDRGQIEAEVAAAQRVGLPASLVEGTDLPYPIEAAVRFEEQAEFHPFKFMAGLARALGGALYEGTRAVSVDAGSPCRVITQGGHTVTAQSVVVATHMPVLDRGLFFARASPERSYCLAAPIEAGEAPGGMYLSTEQPAHSVRVHEMDGKSWLIVGGESHKTGHGDSLERYTALADWMKTSFGLEPVLRWSSHDIMPADGVPFVGRLDLASENLFVATGFRKWGLAMGVASSLLLADLVDGRDHPWRELFEPNRLRLRSSAPSLLKENADTGLRFFGDRLLKRSGVEEIPRGEGRVVGRGLEQRAVYRDESGALHALSARCTHLGCVVNWNRGEATWDCPCHGSRYDTEGAVLEGPAVRPLEPKPLD